MGGVCALTFHIVTVPAPFIHFIRANTVRAKNMPGMERKVWQIAWCSVCLLYQSGNMALPVPEWNISIWSDEIRAEKTRLKMEEPAWFIFSCWTCCQLSSKVEFGGMFEHIFSCTTYRFPCIFPDLCCAVIPCCRGGKEGIWDCWGDWILFMSLFSGFDMEAVPLACFGTV